MSIDIDKVVKQFESRGYEYLGKEDQNTNTIDKLLEELKEFFLNYFDKEFIEERISLPDEYTRFLLEFKGYFYKEDWGGFYGVDNILSDTKSSYEYYWDDEEFEENKKGKTSKEGYTMWITMGDWGDNHEIIMCIDKTNSYYGKVLDVNDTHPICFGIVAPDRIYSSFKDYAEDYKGDTC